VSYLIFCSFEVGGFPFRMAETLNRYGVETYYIYLGRRGLEHDSAQFHYGHQQPAWDLSDSFQNILSDSRKVIQRLNQLKKERNILHCLATGRNAYLLKMAGIEYRYWSYGADIDQECFIRVPLSNTPLCKRLVQHPYRVVSELLRTRKSIKASTSVMISPYQFERLKRICADKNKFFLPHYFKTVDYQKLLQQKTQSKKILREQIFTERYFFSSTRHVWCGSLRDMTDNKGNNIMLNSYAIFKKISRDDPSKFVLINKGPDVESSKLLSRSLGIENNVIWIDEMKRDELDRYYQGATLCFGHFGTPVITYAALEPLANGTISISFSNDNDPSVPYYKEKPPIFSSKDPKEIAEFMVRILARSEDYEGLLYKSWLWIQNNCSEEKFVESFLTIFQKA
jgi:glycosyltransferase involved in cell wall biosynthesis